MSSDPTLDRRRFPRVHSDSLVSIGRLDTQTALAHAIDLSIAGVRFRCVGLGLAAGEVVKTTFTFGESSVTVIGQIVRAEAVEGIAQEVAIQFLKMNDDVRAFLLQHLSGVAESPIDVERRSGVRAVVDTLVAVSRANIVDVVAQSQSLSGGGIHFVVEGLDLELGEILRVTLECDGGPVTAIGQLVRVTHIDEFKQEAALAFLDVESGAVERLRRSLG